MTTKKILSFFLLASVVFILSTAVCLADTPTSILGDGDQGLTSRAEDGSLTLNDFTLTVVVVSRIILGIVGSLALLAFIAGGLMFLLAGGNTERVAQGKQIIFGAVIGLVIVFASYAIIQFVFTALNIQIPAGGSWSTSGWFN